MRRRKTDKSREKKPLKAGVLSKQSKKKKRRTESLINGEGMEYNSITLVLQVY